MTIKDLSGMSGQGLHDTSLAITGLQKSDLIKAKCFLVFGINIGKLDTLIKRI